MQESTFYKEGEHFAPKEFSLKLQGVKGRGKHEKPQTFAKMELDVASYCSCGATGSRDLIVELRCIPCSHWSSQDASQTTWSQPPRDIRRAPASVPITCRPEHGALHEIGPHRTA